MSLSNVPGIQTRIKVATPRSPIAVFKSAVPCYGQLEAVFGNTVSTYRSVQQCDPSFVGFFHNEMDLDLVHGILSDAARD